MVGQSNRLLGYPAGARLLIVNADDFGMCHSVNAATLEVLKVGLVRSTSLMVACPWALQALDFLKNHPGISFGIHLAAISDAEGYPWGPVASEDRLPGLVDPAGHFYDMAHFPSVLG